MQSRVISSWNEACLMCVVFQEVEETPWRWGQPKARSPWVPCIMLKVILRFIYKSDAVFKHHQRSRCVWLSPLLLQGSRRCIVLSGHAPAAMPCQHPLTASCWTTPMITWTPQRTATETTGPYVCLPSSLLPAQQVKMWTSVHQTLAWPRWILTPCRSSAAHLSPLMPSL